MGKNVKSISTKSVSPDELEKQRAALAVAERKLTRIRQRIVQIRDRITVLRQELTEARTQRRRGDTPETVRTVTAAINKVDTAIRQRDKMLVDYRELKQIVREQQALCKTLKKKEETKQKAVAKFLEEWERNYDREIRLKEKNVRQRKKRFARN
jgi:hypothetical protein